MKTERAKDTQAGHGAQTGRVQTERVSGKCFTMQIEMYDEIENSETKESGRERERDRERRESKERQGTSRKQVNTLVSFLFGVGVGATSTTFCGVSLATSADASLLSVVSLRSPH